MPTTMQSSLARKTTLQAATELRNLTEQRARRVQLLESLADRSRPLPAGVPIEKLLKAAQDQLVRECCQEWGLL